LHSIN